MQDEEVAGLAKSGDISATEFLIFRYRPLVESRARSYFMAGADREDVIQEGMIGLYKAIRDFRSGQDHKFRTFAELCITRQIITAVKMATRQKHVPLNASVSLTGRDGERDFDQCFADTGSDIRSETPARQPNFHELEDELPKVLTPLELGVLKCYLMGMTYREICTEVACHFKAVDNAMQRVKKKMTPMLRA